MGFLKREIDQTDEEASLCFDDWYIRNWKTISKVLIPTYNGKAPSNNTLYCWVDRYGVFRAYWGNELTQTQWEDFCTSEVGLCQQ